LLVNAFVGAMVGIERGVLPLLAESGFGLDSRTAILSFLIVFGLGKALSNLFAGGLADRFGRQKVLIAGWLVGLPAPLLIGFAPRWEWVVAANALLGIQQGLCWSSTVLMKIDLAGPARRGFVVGLNEASGYLAVSLASVMAGYVAAHHALTPHPFLLGFVIALAGLAVSALFVRETLPHVGVEAEQHPERSDRRSFFRIFGAASWRDARLAAASQAGLVNNLNDSAAWGLLPLLFASHGLGIERIGMLVAIYPAAWGLLQLATGPLSDRVGRRPLVLMGMGIQALALFLLSVSDGQSGWIAGLLLLGLGTACAYPTLLGVVSDLSHPRSRASTLGVYRFWRDSGHSIGAFGSGLAADALGLRSAIGLVAAITLASGLAAAIRLPETRPLRGDAKALPSGR
jgi:MFS family permease